MLHIVLIEPEIPQNAGNIIRTVAATGTKLYFVKPLGFSLDDKHYKRAGLDYFDKSNLKVFDNYEQMKQYFGDLPIYYASTKAQKNYCDINYCRDVVVCFGPESRGINEDILHQNYNNAIRIPMAENIRSLNLSNSVAIVIYEACRQNNFSGLNCQGKLTKY